MYLKLNFQIRKNNKMCKKSKFIYLFNKLHIHIYNKFSHKIFGLHILPVTFIIE